MSLLPHNRIKIPALWVWLTLVIVVGLVIVGVVSSIVGYWVKNVQFVVNPTPTPPPVTTLQVLRTAPYAGLDITVVSAQSAPFFTDDDIHSGVAVVRLNMQVANHSGDPAKLLYYDCARLLAPKQKPITPTTVHLSTGPKNRASETGWIDFSVPKDVQLASLTLQLGVTSLNESLVNIPFKGHFDAKQYANKISPESAVFSYDYYGHTLNYHLTSVERDFSYQGSQCVAGQQFYVLNFTVDNPNYEDVTPGFAFDYLRLVINGYSQPPIDSTLPNVFKAGSRGTTGRVAFSGPAGMSGLTVGFLSQLGRGQQNFDVGL